MTLFFAKHNQPVATGNDLQNANYHMHKQLRRYEKRHILHNHLLQEACVQSDTGKQDDCFLLHERSPTHNFEFRIADLLSFLLRKSGFFIIVCRIIFQIFFGYHVVVLSFFKFFCIFRFTENNTIIFVPTCE